ncbi:MAG: DUF368 domain-containing protein [Defluviitaleaceae bacterium]|nr:DUF368 domain-containing protein [Defluviitaleaceae bacterium]
MKFNSIFKTIFYGLCLGISLLPPGFSVATMAMILGIYEELIGLLNDLFSTKMKQTLKPLVSLGVGAVFAIAVFAWLIRRSMMRFPYQTRFFFIGLIVATVPLIYKQADVKTNFRLKHGISLIIAFVITASFIFGGNVALVDLGGDMTILKIIYLMFAGALVSSSMILPGLSGALMLILIGAYEFLLASISSLDVVVLSSVALGGIIGLVICGRLIKHLIENNETTLYATSMGLVLGSIPVMLSHGIPTEGFDTLTSLITAIIGFVIVTVLNLKKA